MTSRKGNRGLTLIEILLVLALLGIVMSIIGGRVFSGFTRGKVQSTKIAIKQLEGNLDRYRLDCNFYPTEAEGGLKALVEKPTAGRDCKNYDPNGYLDGKKKEPSDSWGTPFRYESDGLKYVITSLGNDGAEGGEGENADIRSDEE